MKAHTADYCITVGYWPSDMADPPVSISLLAMMLTTIGQQVTFLQDKNILPKTGLCRKCYATILGEYKVKKNERYWRCTKCNITTSLRFGTILYQTKLKLINFIMLVYSFTKPPLLQESRLTGGGSPNLMVLVEWKVPVEGFMGAANCFH